MTCPDAHWRVWNAYVKRVPAGWVPVVRLLFERLCETVHEKQRCWAVGRHGQTIGFRAASGEPFAIGIHVDRQTPPSFVIRVGAPLAARGETDPDPDLPVFWGETHGVVGWNVVRERDVPDFARAVDLAAKYNASC